MRELNRRLEKAIREDILQQERSFPHWYILVVVPEQELLSPGIGCCCEVNFGAFYGVYVAKKVLSQELLNACIRREGVSHFRDGCELFVNSVVR